MLLIFHYWNVLDDIHLWMFPIFHYWSVVGDVHIWMFLIFRYWNVPVVIHIWMFPIFHYWNDYITVRYLNVLQRIKFRQPDAVCRTIVLALSVLHSGPCPDRTSHVPQGQGRKVSFAMSPRVRGAQLALSCLLGQGTELALPHPLGLGRRSALQ